VRSSLEASRDIDMSSMSELTAARNSLGRCLHVARELSVSEADLKDSELRRRKLHNTIEDLKGSIRVFCRIRPLSDAEGNQGDVNVIRQLDGMTIGINKEDPSSNSKAAVTPFAFDAVFTPGTQEEVFEDCRDLVRSAADGYNVTLFAYGQTGAGKTYTMEGTEDDPGVSHRTITEIFKVVDDASTSCEWTVTGSVIELYRQDIRDLYAMSQDEADQRKLQIRAESIEGLLEKECKTAAELTEVISEASKVRKVASTALNKDSSRSHLLFVIKITSINRETGEKIQGKIMVVDLAGSERLAKSMVTGEEAKEAIEINKSLTALGDVIEALTTGQKQIPYRNHKLTMLMQDSVGGTAKTLMFVNCSPAKTNISETLNSLKYATRAKNITNSTPKRRPTQTPPQLAQ